MADTLLNPTITSESGHVLKNVGMVESINAPLEMRVDAKLYSWECSRILRRDFNLVARKMFMALVSRKDWRDTQIRSLLKDVTLAGETFTVNCSRYKLTRDIPHHSEVPLRLISAESATLYKTFVIVDEGMRRLACAVSDGKMNNEQRTGLFRQFERPYADLKALVLHGRATAKSSEELAAEMGIE